MCVCGQVVCEQVVCEEVFACVNKLCVWTSCVCEQVVDKLCVSKLCVHKLCVDKLCVSRRAEAEEEEGGSAGVPNQKQEPHTKMWGKTSKPTDRDRRTHEMPSAAACSHFTRKHTWFRAPASSPKQTPCNIHAAITMRFAAPRGKPASIHAHGNRT